MIKSFVQKLLTKFAVETAAAMQPRIDTLYNDLFGLWQIQLSLNTPLSVEELSGWSLTPYALGHILSRVAAHPAPTVVEFGSGVSTLLIAYSIKDKDNSRLIIVEHDPKFANKTMNTLHHHGLSKNVEMVIAPLIEYSKYECASYDLSAIHINSLIDYCIIDGPPCTNGMLTRLPPAEWAICNLSKTGIIWLDDTERPGEQECLNKISRNYPTIKLEPYMSTKGFATLCFNEI